MSNLKPNLSAIKNGASSQSSQGLIINQYCTSILQQPPLDFSAFDNDKDEHQDAKKLIEVGEKINETLAAAKGYATQYLETTKPLIITNLTNIDRYANLHGAISTVVPPGSSEDRWLQTLRAAEQQARRFEGDSVATAEQLRKLHLNLSEVAATLNGLRADLETIVNSDGGILNRISESLSEIHGKIAAAITGIALGGLVVAGGIFVVAVGAVASFVTAGTSLKVVAGGVALIAIGAGGVVGGSLALVELLKQEGDLMRQQASLRVQMKLATSTEANVSKISKQTSDAADAAQQMASAWTALGGTLGNLANDLEEGRTNTDVLRELFLTTANEDVADVKAGVATIKKQMTGVDIQIASPNQNVVELSRELISRHAA